MERGLISKYDWKRHQPHQSVSPPTVLREISGTDEQKEQDNSSLKHEEEGKLQKYVALDWENINFGLLHKIIKKMFSPVGQNCRTGRL